MSRVSKEAHKIREKVMADLMQKSKKLYVTDVPQEVMFDYICEELEKRDDEIIRLSLRVNELLELKQIDDREYEELEEKHIMLENEYENLKYELESIEASKYECERDYDR